MLPKTAGSSLHSATGSPLFIMMGSGCMGIDEVKRWFNLSYADTPIECIGTYQHLVRYRANLDADSSLAAYFHDFRVLDDREAVRQHDEKTIVLVVKCLAYPCPMRFVPSSTASYKLSSGSDPSPSVSPAWKMNGMRWSSGNLAASCIAGNLRSTSA